MLVSFGQPPGCIAGLCHCLGARGSLSPGCWARGTWCFVTLGSVGMPSPFGSRYTWPRHPAPSRCQPVPAKMDRGRAPLQPWGLPVPRSPIHHTAATHLQGRRDRELVNKASNHRSLKGPGELRPWSC